MYSQVFPPWVKVGETFEAASFRATNMTQEIQAARQWSNRRTSAFGDVASSERQSVQASYARHVREFEERLRTQQHGLVVAMGVRFEQQLAEHEFRMGKAHEPWPELELHQVLQHPRDRPDLVVGRKEQGGLTPHSWSVEWPMSSARGFCVYEGGRSPCVLGCVD